MKDQPTAQAFDPYPETPDAIVFAPLWMLVHTNPQREAQVMTKLMALRFEVFLPLARNRPGDPDRPLFPRYLFVDVERPDRISGVTNCEHVSSVLRGAGGEFYCVREDAVADLRDQCAAGIVLTRTKEIKIGETVIIPSGPLEGRTGEVRWVRSDLVGGVLQIMGRAAPFSIRRDLLEA